VLDTIIPQRPGVTLMGISPRLLHCSSPQNTLLEIAMMEVRYAIDSLIALWHNQPQQKAEMETSRFRNAVSESGIGGSRISHLTENPSGAAN
jgi:hypothetical protein